MATSKLIQTKRSFIKNIYKNNNNIYKRNMNYNYVNKKSELIIYNLLLCLCIISYFNCVTGQAITRDPRFYSREGVFDYNPPNPGDPDYR